MFYFGAENYDGTVTGFPKSFLPAEMRTKYHPNYEIWTNKGKYRLKKANISRFWLIFFDFENILRNNYAPFGCNYAPDWCIFLHLVIIKIGEINELKFKDKLQ